MPPGALPRAVHLRAVGATRWPFVPLAKFEKGDLWDDLISGWTWGVLKKVRKGRFLKALLQRFYGDRVSGPALGIHEAGHPGALFLAWPVALSKFIGPGLSLGELDLPEGEPNGESRVGVY
jgi:hypothetical protein